MIVTIQPAQGPSKTIVIERKVLGVQVRGVVDSARIIKGEPGPAGMIGSPGPQGPQGPAGPAGGAAQAYSKIFKLTAADIQTRSLALEVPVEGEYVLLKPLTGVIQTEGRDFSLDKVENKIKWASKWLDGILREDEEIFVQYFVAP